MYSSELISAISVYEGFIDSGIYKVQITLYANYTPV